MSLDLVHQPYSRHAVRVGVYLSNQLVIVAGPKRGKTTLIENIQRSIGPLEHVSAGRFMRERARELGYGDDIDAFAAHMRAHPEEGNDAWCDGKMQSLSTKNRLLVDTHLPCFFPYGFIVKLVCSPETCAQRIAKPGDDIAVLRAKIDKREKDDEAKYASIYPGSVWAKEDYDLVLNTETHGSKQCLDIVLAEHEAWLSRNRHNLIVGDKMPSPALVAS